MESRILRCRNHTGQLANAQIALILFCACYRYHDRLHSPLLVSAKMPVEYEIGLKEKLWVILILSVHNICGLLVVHASGAAHVNSMWQFIYSTLCRHMPGDRRFYYSVILLFSLKSLEIGQKLHCNFAFRMHRENENG